MTWTKMAEKERDHVVSQYLHGGTEKNHEIP